jgi:hypothetical protein
LRLDWLLLLEEGDREPDRDRRPLPRGALDGEPPATDLCPLPHHRHPEVTFGARSARVEADAVVAKGEHDVVALLAHADPDVPRLRVLQRVHHTFAGDVEDEKGDRGREIDVLDVSMESDRGVTTDLVGERLERLGQTLRAERGSVQVSDQRSDPVRGLLFGFTDLVELFRDVLELTLLEELPRDVDLDRKAEEHLRQIVVEVPSDLQALVGSFFCHGVRERTKDMLTLFQLLVRLLQSLGPKEHLPRKQKGR